jgi:hypothetical protein
VQRLRAEVEYWRDQANTLRLLVPVEVYDSFRRLRAQRQAALDLCDEQIAAHETKAGHPVDGTRTRVYVAAVRAALDGDGG